MPRGSPLWNELVRIWLRDSFSNTSKHNSEPVLFILGADERAAVDSISNTSKHISEPVLFILGAYERAAVMKTSKLRNISSQLGFAFKRSLV